MNLVISSFPYLSVNFFIFFPSQSSHNIHLFNSKFILSLFNSSIIIISRRFSQFSISSRSIPYIFLFLQLVQFLIIFNVSSNSFDGSVVLTFKSFSLICSLFINSSTFILIKPFFFFFFFFFLKKKKKFFYIKKN